MTYNAPHDKAVVAATRTDFLDALYSSADPKLWLELRCIHPNGPSPQGISNQVKALWMPVQKREAILKRGDALNREGYGLYFAPCPRIRQRGNAEAAALLPALWADLDCDNDPARREIALAKLHKFNPPPSVIVDSGGGWHAYWLTSEPFLLTEQSNREYAARLLRGLFRVLGADPEYVKSVASIMRLPDSVNTKPERGGSVVAIAEFKPNRRYAISDFAWLEVIADQSSNLSSESDHSPLPRVTLDYLAHGATDGTRNKALFDAACQFRDAGYSQIEAETQLVPRYVADGTGETASSREHEARATIGSAYKRTARDPISPSHEQFARQKVEMLTQRYLPASAERQYPTHTEIAEAVAACADLNPVEWATERQRLKHLCHDGLRVADLDRLYRQAKRDKERSDRQAMTVICNADYSETDGKMIYHRITDKGPSEQTVATWTARIVERVSQVNDDGQTEHLTILELRGQQTVQLQVPSELFGDDAALRRFIAGRAGEEFTVRAGMGKHLAPAILSLSESYPRRTTYRFMGWTKLDGNLTYVAPGLSVTAQGVMPEAPVVELESRLRDYGLIWPEDAQWIESLNAFEAGIQVFPKALAPTCIAFTLLPIVQRFFPAAAPKPALHLVGTYQSGKSELAALMCSFYGSFTRDAPPGQWGDTINTVEAVGYPLADALYWVDDYKTIYADERTFTRFLQSYSRGMGRGRLNRESKMRQDRPCRGLLLSTGETVLEGEASVLSRMLMLEVPPWEQRDPGGKALAQADVLRQHLPGFTARFTAWIANQIEHGDLAGKLAKGFAV